MSLTDQRIEEIREHARIGVSAFANRHDVADLLAEVERLRKVAEETEHTVREQIAGEIKVARSQTIRELLDAQEHGTEQQQLERTGKASGLWVAARIARGGGA